MDERKENELDSIISYCQALILFHWHSQQYKMFCRMFLAAEKQAAMKQNDSLYS